MSAIQRNALSTLPSAVRYSIYLLCWYKSTCFTGTKVSQRGALWKLPWGARYICVRILQLQRYATELQQSWARGARYMCVRILLYVSSFYVSAIYVSSYYYICVLSLQVCALICHSCSYCYICVRYYICVFITLVCVLIIYVFSFCKYVSSVYMCPHSIFAGYYICVLIILYMCSHSVSMFLYKCVLYTIYVS